MRTRQENTAPSSEIVLFRRPERADLPIFLSYQERERGEAVFALDLAGVETTREEARSASNADLNQEPGLGLLEAAVAAMKPGWALEFSYGASSQHPFAWRVVGQVSGTEQAELLDNAQQLYESLLLAFHAEGRGLRFAPVRDQHLLQRGLSEAPWRTCIMPRSVRLDSGATRPIGFALPHTPIQPTGAVLLPLQTETRSKTRNNLPAILRECKSPVEVRLILRRVRLDAAQIQLVGKALRWFQNGRDKRIKLDETADTSVACEDFAKASMNFLASWAGLGEGVAIRAEVRSTACIPAALHGAVANEFYPGREAVAQTGDTGVQSGTTGEILDLSTMIPLGYPLAPVFPEPAQLRTANTPKAYSRPIGHLVQEGIVLGQTSGSPQQQLVRFSQSDRNRHCYIIGGTGTGKSTLLANMIRQDIEAGEGVTLLDPHGDLFTQVLPCVPESRAKDLIIIDPRNRERAVGINMLECGGPNREAQMHFAINEMIKIFYRLYDRAMMGPMFETYMRTAMLLLLDHDSPSEATVTDIPRVFEDREYRNGLKKRCRNKMVVDRWTHTFESCSGDQSLANMASYVTGKLNMFIYNNLIKNIVGQAKSTIDFRKAIDHRKIVLINLCKGDLGQLDCQFLGMLIIGKIFGAALSRANQTLGMRAPHYLYIDEFQNFTTDTVVDMMAESRKYELRLTLANQNLGQLEHHQDWSGQNIMESVLGNVGSLLCMRIGPADAQKLELYTKPELQAQDLQYLPDYHVAARLLTKNTPVRPFVFQTLPFNERRPSAALLRAVKNSVQRYTQPMLSETYTPIPKEKPPISFEGF